MPLYRLLVSLFALWTLARAALRGDGTALRERLAFGPVEPGPHLWLHAASNGELASARPVIEALRRARPDLAILVTCNSATGVALARDWGLTARLAPLDLAHVARRMHRRWQVTAHVAMESELWPHRVLTCPGPVLVLGGRLSAGTARGWRAFGALQRRVLGRLAWVSAQDAASLERYREGGLPPEAAGPVVDLKSFYAPPDLHDPALEQAFVRGSTWLAASTHPGEEEIVLDAHRRARRQEPDLRLILAPRHPRRADEIERMIEAAGPSCARRSRGEAPRAEVYLADTLGEMALFYPLAGRVFIGGTLTDRGGHTPYEPAAFGAALLHGPDVANFRAPFAALDAAGAALPVENAAGLAQALGELRAPAEQQRLGAAAQETLASGQDVESLVAEVLQRVD
ncbi:3-deoxy-D-manno-octulosonic acid transferase [Salipiger mucosus]|uniref:3-deoxy-D-manno-octulosonic acid transferase n=1 Tax=Salipiger mucosus DSM 16094 TaxID=1123237 RepID=S9S704_9RHOB|nr:glycosyltransferase N-terminal domain-containing protein [Salipiger mucosus]EPX81999.1 3-deoxy-D-manno-octulosonic-acid transferase [Salipiger mucosus DSM 16094]